MKASSRNAATLAVLMLGASGIAAAAVTDLSQTPLASSASNLVKPNVSFVLDASGSMAWSHAPDESEPFYNNIGYKGSQCNSIYYNPAIIYPPARNSDGTTYPNSSFTAAQKDAFYASDSASSSTVNLSTSFYAYDNTTSNGNGTDTAQQAYYYKYLGVEAANGTNYQNTSSNFYLECSYNDLAAPQSIIILSSPAPTSTKVTSITVNGVQIMSSSSSSSSTVNTEAANVAAKITANGFSATVSGPVITITGPLSARSFVPVVTKTGNMVFQTVAFTPFTRVNVSATSGPTGNDERQNFANWFSYYRTRILMMKSGLGRAFVGISSNYRVGFLTIQGTPSNSTTDPEYLAIADFTATQKATFYSRIYSKDVGNGTPLRFALSTAARNIAGKVGPDPQQYSCQQNFILLSTDGYWNKTSASAPVGVKLDGSTAVGNQDGNIVNTPRPMYDGGVAGATNTLADVAAYYYNTDLRPGPTCNTGVSGADVCQDNVPISGLDNAPWQHVTLFTLGLGTNGILNYDAAYLTGGSADFQAIASGSKDWPLPVGDTLTTIDDLWHAAVNGHGQYFSAKNPDLLVSGLQTALAGVSAREAAGSAAATSNLEPVAGDNFAFVANYRTQDWDGDVEERTIDLVTGAISTVAVWSAQVQLDAMTTANGDSRTIFTVLGGTKVDFQPGSFSPTQKTAWFTPGNAPALSQFAGWNGGQAGQATPDSIITYLRGQFGNEERGSNPGNQQLYRTRAHVLGDIINGKPVYVRLPPFNYQENNYLAFKTSPTLLSRPGTVYVAANDGMLHALDSATGNERWAYIPSFVLPNLKALASDSYANSHQYFVDGSPTVSDVWNGSAWRTILVGGLNGGGKGYYALDVTDPTTPLVLWEYSEANLGFTYGNPIVAKLADGSWNVFFTSGYNNADGVGRLYVLDAMTGVLKFQVSTGVGLPATPSGLAKISAWVDNGLLDNTVQRLYGGDMLGNLWRFDVNDSIAPAGREATQLAFFLVGAYQQPITTTPELGLVSNKPTIYIGTGRYLGASDLSDLNQQSLYAIVDNLTATGLGNARTETTCPLVQQSLTVINVNSRSTSTLPVNLASKCGWFLDFNPVGGNTPGERVNVDPKLQLGVLAVSTNIPEQSVCTVGGSSFLYFFDYATGQFVSTSTGGIVGQRIGNAIAVGLNTYRLPDGRVVTTVTTSDDQHPVFANPSNPFAGAIGKRVGWRELLN